MNSLDDVFLQYGLSTAEVAKELKVTPTAVRYWRHGRNPLTCERAMVISAKFGIPRHVLRPDIWDPATAPPA